MRTADLLLENAELYEQNEAFEKLEKRYFAMLQTLPEEDRELAKAYRQSMTEVYEIMFHVAAGFPKGML